MAEASAAEPAGSAASQLPAATEAGSSGRPAAERREDLVALYRHLRDCHECPLAKARTNLVFGSGDADADLMFVGEAPGFHEDQQGIPFVGRAGKLLDELLGEIGLGRGDVFVANCLKCRPPGNRDPHPDEIEECTPHLMRQIELIEPRVICTLGNFSTKLLTGSSQGITRQRGRAQERELGGRTVRLYPILHPAAALRSDNVRQQLREDFHRLPELIAEPRPLPAATRGLVEQGGQALREGHPAASDRRTGGDSTDQGEPSGDAARDSRVPQDEASQLGLFG